MARYELLVKIASGGMGAVYVGRLRGAMGFEQLVAIKRPHAHLLEKSEVKRNLMAEARVASRIRHANVVGVRDVDGTDDALLLVMDYVEGASLIELIGSGDRQERIRAGLRIVLDACAGLQAAHDLVGDDGQPLGIVHRDISPHNILVGLDGVGRLADFGIAKSLYGSEPSTVEGTIKGKLAYMAPECFNGGVGQPSDIFSMGVVLWELLTGSRLFAGKSEAETLKRVLSDEIPLVSSVTPDVGSSFDDVVARALERDPKARFACATDLLTSLESAIARADLGASRQDVARFVHAQVEEKLQERRARVNASMHAADATTNEGIAVSAPTQTLTIDDTKRPSRRVAIGAAGILALGLAVLGVLRGTRTDREPVTGAAEATGSASVVVPDAASMTPETFPSGQPSSATPPGPSSAPARPNVKAKAPKPPSTKADRPFRNPY